MGKIVENNRKTLIYTLSDPLTNEIRYVGKTVKSLKERLTGHLYLRGKENNYRTNWIKSIVKSGNIPIINQIDETTWDKSQELEKYWIKKFKNEGYRLVNLTDGGEGALGCKRSKEAILKSSISMRENQKRVYQYSLNGIFIKDYRSCKDASEEINGRSENISQCCLLNKKSHKEFIWSYLTPDEIDFEKYKHKIKNFKPSENNNFIQKRTPILIIDLITNERLIVESIKDASILTGVAESGICMQCKHGRTIKKSYKFQYAEK
jgi:hypothetical protein